MDVLGGGLGEHRAQRFDPGGAVVVGERDIRRDARLGREGDPDLLSSMGVAPPSRRDGDLISLAQVRGEGLQRLVAVHDSVSLGDFLLGGLVGGQVRQQVLEVQALEERAELLRIGGSGPRSLTSGEGRSSWSVTSWRRARRLGSPQASS